MEQDFSPAPWSGTCAAHRMHRPRPRRVDGYPYVGAGRYHIRTSTNTRRHEFLDPRWARAVVSQLLQHASDSRFEVLAYCVMPDHVHLLVASTNASADLERFVTRWKQSTGFAYAQCCATRLWQSGYFERVLRAEDTTEHIAAYIVANPVRAGLTTRVGQYEFAWAKGMTAMGTQD